MSDRQLGEELHKSIIRTFNKPKVHSSFIVNIWGADLADLQLISKFNKGIHFRFLLCVVYIFSKYAWVIPLDNRKGITITDAFQKILKVFNRKPNELSVDKGSKFYNKSMKSCLKKAI